MIRSIIVDDEENTIEELKDILESFGNIEIIACETNPFKALEIIEDNKIDVAFLDIDMPGINGITLSEKIKTISPNIEIIFITAYNQYAIEAFEVDAIDYVLKPIRKERIEKSIKRILKLIKEEDNNYRIKIRSFKKFEVLIDNTIVKWRIIKDGELFAYLIENVDIPIHKEKIIQDLWDDVDLKNGLIYLQSSIYRIRKILSNNGYKNCIIYTNNCYIMKRINIDCDIWRYNDYLNKEYLINKDNVDIYDNLIKIYTGDYLEEDGYLWAINISENYRLKYMELLEKVSEYYIRNGNYEKSIKYMEKVVEIDSSYERGIIKLFNIYYEKKDFYNLRKQFVKLNKLSEERYGIELSESILKYYNSLK